MAASCGDFQSSLDRLLAFNLCEVNFVLVGLPEDTSNIHFGGCDFGFTFEETGGLAQILDGDDPQAGNHRGLGRVFRWHEHPNHASPACAERNRQYTLHRTHCTCWLVATAPSAPAEP